MFNDIDFYSGGQLEDFSDLPPQEAARLRQLDMSAGGRLTRLLHAGGNCVI